MPNVKKLFAGTMVGAAAGLIDSAFMVAMKHPLEMVLAGFAFWAVDGLIIAASDIGIKGFLKGAAISLLLLIPVGMPLAWNAPSSILSMALFTGMMGGVVGHVTEKF